MTPFRGVFFVGGGEERGYFLKGCRGNFFRGKGLVIGSVDSVAFRRFPQRLTLTILGTATFSGFVFDNDSFAARQSFRRPPDQVGINARLDHIRYQFRNVRHLWKTAPFRLI